MSALAPSGVGLPAPDCLLQAPAGSNNHTAIRLSDAQGARRWLAFVPSVFDCQAQLSQLVDRAELFTLISADTPTALAACELPQALARYCDPTLNAALLYGIRHAANGCHYALFDIERGFVRQSLISQQLDLALWQQLLTRKSN